MLDFRDIRMKPTSHLGPPSPLYQMAHNSILTGVSKNKVERKSFNTLIIMTKGKFARLKTGWEGWVYIVLQRRGRV